MRKSFKKRVKAAMWGSTFIVILLSAIILWWLCYNAFSDPTILTDFAKTLNDGNASAFEMTWSVFWVGFPIIILLQLGGCTIMSALIEYKDEKVSEKPKKKEKKK